MVVVDKALTIPEGAPALPGQIIIVPKPELRPRLVYPTVSRVKGDLL